jgi:hypothetical protein
MREDLSVFWGVGDERASLASPSSLFDVVGEPIAAKHSSRLELIAVP